MVEIQILWSNAELLAVNKPPGLPVHETPGPGGSVLRTLKEQGLGELTPVHRLDKDASGVLLLARTKSAAAAVQREWERAEKFYWALCEGVPEPSKGLIDAPILEHQTGKPERLRNALRWYAEQHPGLEIPPVPAPKTSAVHRAGRSSQTEYRVLAAYGAFAALEVRPRQGRMHQIRVHLAFAGHPLAVDPLYGKRRELQVAPALVLSRIPLHALRLKFPCAAGFIDLQAPLAEDLAQVQEALAQSGERRL